jgi:ATP-dependent Clp protease adapter protein ClpS
MIAQELEVSLHMTFVEARQRRHEFITVEHLLLALLDNPTAAQVLRACGADMDELRRTLAGHVREHTPCVAADREVDTQPTLGFQRTIQRAILHVQSSGEKEVTGANVLVAIFGEKDSHAVDLLQQHGIKRLEVLNYISHGIVPAPQSPSATPRERREPKIAEDDAELLQVVLFNDDHTPMQVVVDALRYVLQMNEEEAKEVMLEVHREGMAVCGLYPRETARLIVSQVTAYSHRLGHPLRCETAVQK